MIYYNGKWLIEPEIKAELDRLNCEVERLERENAVLRTAEWLTELKDLRDENKNLKEEYTNLNKISYGFYKELKEAKRLLKSATNVLNMFIPCDEDYNCSECIKQRKNCDYDDSFKWRYADEALKLIGGEEDENSI